MNRLWMSGAAAVMAVSIAGVHAQTTGSQDPQNPQTQAQRQQATADETTTVRGCVYKERDIPGRSPNVAERAGVLEDYILVTNTSAAGAQTGATGTAGTTPPTTQPTTPQTAGTTGTAATRHPAFKLEHASDDRLQAMVGKMVEVTGKLDAERDDTRGVGTTGAPATDRVPANPDQIELPEFEVTSIREVQGNCPATPNLQRR